MAAFHSLVYAYGWLALVATGLYLVYRLEDAGILSSLAPKPPSRAERRKAKARAELALLAAELQAEEEQAQEAAAATVVAPRPLTRPSALSERAAC